MMKLRKSPDFRSVYASGVWVGASPTEFRLLFFNNEPIEVEAENEKDPTRSIKEEPYFQAEVIITRPLAEWIRTSLDAFLKQTEAKPSESKVNEEKPTEEVEVPKAKQVVEHTEEKS